MAIGTSEIGCDAVHDNIDKNGDDNVKHTIVIIIAVAWENVHLDYIYYYTK